MPKGETDADREWRLQEQQRKQMMADSEAYEKAVKQSMEKAPAPLLDKLEVPKDG